MQQPSDSTPQAADLPQQLTRFVGRRAELHQLGAMLTDPECRLLTVTGLGGLGKTRLALQATAEHAEHFEDGVVFVNLQPLRAPDQVAATICSALNLTLSNRQPPRAQLVHFLRTRNMLLVLDNFEHLLDATDLLVELLHAAPAVTCLVTTRVALNVQGEWLFSVHGLDFPAAEQMPGGEDALRAYGAVQLFADRARRVRPSFSLPDEAAAVIRICQLVEGVPLAIELAAAWTRTMRCAEIAAEIQHNMDFLASTLRDMPERHRSMQAVFVQSWQLLGETERTVFQQLSIFRGGFTREAAESVAGASLHVLSSLVDRSLLRWEADGRYQMHELLRQYAYDKLQQTPDEAEQAMARHCAFYIQLLHRREKDLLGQRRRELLADFADEMENVRQAWHWAVQAGLVDRIAQGVYTLQEFYDARGQALEAATLLEMAVQQLESQETDASAQAVLAYTLAYLGALYMRCGQLDKAEAAMARAHTIHETLDAPLTGFGADPLAGRGLLANVRGQYADAIVYATEALQRAERRTDQNNLQVIHYVLANAHAGLGRYETARTHARQAHVLAQRRSNLWFDAYVLNDLGTIARAQGEYVQATRHYEEGYRIKAQFGDPEGQALALANLARVAWLTGDYARAEAQYRQSLSLYEQIDDQGGLATVLNGLADTLRATGDLTAARSTYHRALQIAAEMRFWPLLLEILTSVGTLLWQTEQSERSLDVLTLVWQHPAAMYETKTRAQQVLADATAVFDATALAAMEERAQTLDIEDTAAELLLTLELASQKDDSAVDDAEKQASPSATSSPVAPQQPEQPLVEPLTPRELQVLRLLANGLSNAEIAEELIIALGTVKSYTGNIYGKLGVHNRTQAVLRAQELKILDS